MLVSPHFTDGKTKRLKQLPSSVDAGFESKSVWPTRAHDSNLMILNSRFTLGPNREFWKKNIDVWGPITDFALIGLRELDW